MSNHATNSRSRDCPDDSLWQAYLQGDKLHEETFSRIDAHLEQCPRCADRLRNDASLPLISMADALRKAARMSSSLFMTQPFSTTRQSAPTLDFQTSNPGPRPTALSFSPSSLSPATMVAPASTVRVGNYELIRWINSGGMGAVYLAWQVSVERHVAVKMLRPRSLHSETAVRRLIDEARRMAQLRHDNIVQVIDVGEHDGWPFFSMELVDGDPLDEALRKSPLTPAQSADLIIAVAEAVHTAHQANLVHRDLKPSNILLTRDKIPKVTDFGLAITRDELSTRGGREVAGTAVYMAPEQWDGELTEIGPHTDIYGLGATLYELLTGRPPFPIGEDKPQTRNRVLYEPPAPPRSIQRRIPRDLEAICLKCLEKSPEKRYDSALKVADDLRRFQSRKSVEAHPVGVLGEVGYFGSRHWPWLAIAACALAIIGALLAFGRAENRKVRLNEAAASFQRGVEELRNGHSPQGFALLETAILQSSALDPSLSRYYQSSADAWRRRSPREVRSLVHSGLADKAVMSPDGKHVLFSDLRNAAWLWSLEEKTPRNILPPQETRILYLAFSPDGSLCALGSGTETEIWSVADRKKVSSSVEPFYRPSSFTFLGNDRFATGTPDSSQPIRLWRLASPRAEPISSSIAIQGGTIRLASAIDGSALAALTRDGCWLWRGEGTAAVPLIGKDLADISDLAFSPDGKTLALISEANQLVLVNVSDGRVRQPRRSLAPAQRVSQLAFHGNSAIRLTLDLDHAMVSRELSLEFSSWDEFAIATEGSPVFDDSGSSNFFVTGVSGNVLRVWEPPASSLRSIALEADPAMASTSFSDDGSQVATLIRPLTRKLAPAEFGVGNALSARRSCFVQLYDRNSFGETMFGEQLPENMIGFVIAHGPQPGRFAVGCEAESDGPAAVLLAELGSDRKLRFQKLGAHSQTVSALGFDFRGERLYSGSFKGADQNAELICWRAIDPDNPSSGFQEEHRTVCPGTIRSFAVVETEGSARRLLAIGGGDGVIRVRDVRDLSLDGRTAAAEGSVSVMAYSRERHLLAAGTAHGQILLFRVEENGLKEIARDSNDLTAPVVALQFHPQRPELYAAFQQAQKSLKISVWDVDLWRTVGPPRTLPGDLIGHSFGLTPTQSAIAAISRKEPFLLFFSL